MTDTLVIACVAARMVAQAKEFTRLADKIRAHGCTMTVYGDGLLRLMDGSTKLAVAASGDPLKQRLAEVMQLRRRGKTEEAQRRQ